MSREADRDRPQAPPQAPPPDLIAALLAGLKASGVGTVTPPAVKAGGGS